MKNSAGSKRTTKIVHHKFFGITSWEVRYYRDGHYLCSSKRKTREKARITAKRYTDTGIIPLF